MNEEELEETVSPCPSWCISAHDDDASGARVHRGATLHGVFRARWRDGSGAALTEPGAEEFDFALRQYDGEDEAWVASISPSNHVLEVELRDMNRWIVMLGDVLVGSTEGDGRQKRKSARR